MAFVWEAVQLYSRYASACLNHSNLTNVSPGGSNEPPWLSEPRPEKYHNMKKPASKYPSRYFYYGLYLVSTLLPFLIVLLNLVAPEQRKFLLSEAGPIEMGSVIAWLACSMFLILLYIKNIWKGGIAASVICFAFALRELDFQKKFTVMSIDKINFYIESKAPIIEKLIVGFIVLFLFYLTFHLIRKNYAVAWQGLKEKKITYITLAIATLLLPLSKILDRFPNRLKEAGIYVSETTKQQASILEEVVELIIPLLILLLILQCLNFVRPLTHSRED